MKYIDADKLKREAELAGFCRETTDDFAKLIDGQPAADVIPVKHGCVLENDDGAYTCSVCGERYICKDNYCSHCAARLDKDKWPRLVAGTYLDWDNGRYCPTFGSEEN